MKNVKTKEHRAPLDNFGPYDYFMRTTLVRLYRETGLPEEEAQKQVFDLIAAGEIKVGKHTGLLMDYPLYQKIAK